MKVAIAGGHGRIALQLTELLTGAGDEVASLIRNPDHAADVEAAGGTPVVLDLEQATGPEIASGIGSADAVVFAAGAGPDSGPERKESVDHGAATKLVEAGRALKIDRFVMVSSMGADPEHDGDEVFDAYLRAKGLADRELMASGLTYVVVRPGMLTDDPPTGKVDAGLTVERGEIPRADVAAVLAECLRSESIADHAFEVVGGDAPIAEAIAWI